MQSVWASMNRWLSQGIQPTGLTTGANWTERLAPLWAAVPLAEGYTFLIRWIMPCLALWILFRCMVPLLRGGGDRTIWGFLEIEDSYRVPLTRWENSIGRSKLSDVVLNLPYISRSHAVLALDEAGWRVTDLGSSGGVTVNGVPVEHSCPVEEGDEISFAGAAFRFAPATEEGYDHVLPQGKWEWVWAFGDRVRAGKSLLLLVLFQLLGTFQLFLTARQVPGVAILFPMGIFIAAECVFYGLLREFSTKRMELELLIFFLCGLNLFVVATAQPVQMNKQLIAILLGLGIFYGIQFFIRNPGQGRKLKYIFAVGAVILILLNLVIGETRFGAKNWINLGFFTIQPMELVKVAFVLAGTGTLDKLLTTRNMTAFIGFSGSCIGALILMRDLGGAVIFFVAFLVIAFMRSGDVRTLAYISSAAALGAFAVVSFLPYVASRFKAWGHVWEYADSIGYQQARTMTAAASGGLLGVGGGNGFLHRVAAADTDLVFGIICEEWGLIIGLVALSILLFLSVYAIFLVTRCKSSFYAIAASGAVSIFLIQTALNVFGSLDLLPLTGVTLPFVSNGGSSMVSCWALLAFIKAADHRVRPDVVRDGEEDTEEDEEGSTWEEAHGWYDQWDEEA